MKATEPTFVLPLYIQAYAQFNKPTSTKEVKNLASEQAEILACVVSEELFTAQFPSFKFQFENETGDRRYYNISNQISLTFMSCKTLVKIGHYHAIFDQEEVKKEYPIQDLTIAKLVDIFNLINSKNQ